MPTMMEIPADAIKDAGTPFIIGHPGGESVELMDAARQRDMRFALMKQEVAGDAGRNLGREYRLARICLSTRGPSATKMVNRVAYALIDRAPLIAITDQYSAPIYETGRRQCINQQAVSTPLVKRSAIGQYVAQFNALRDT
jgi:acetolactate synthase I/II/III large subunit